MVGCSLITFSQKREVDSMPKNLEDYILVKPGDTVTIQLKEFSILPKHKFNSREDVRYYLWFRSKVYKAYPYAQLASQRLDSLNARLQRIKSKRKRKKYTKHVQKYIEGEFTDQIKKMTTTEGRILIKLIHRQTGKTAFNTIKGLRSGWKAFWYNTTANIFKLSLKTEYHPETINEDFLIEDILQRAFQEDKLQAQNTKLNFDFHKIIAERKAQVNVEEYKLMFAKIKKKKKRKKIKKN
jgi:translation initiation factor IF-1